MHRLTAIPILLLIGLATVSAQAAPMKLFGNAPTAIDRFVDILRPWELVGPPVDPNGPLTRAGGLQLNLEPEPAPWRAPAVQATGY